MSSSFLLDTSRRVLIPGPVTSAGIPASLYGELSADCLKGIGFTYKEEFASGHKELEKSVDNVAKPITTAMNALMKALPIGAGVSIDGASDLRAKAIEAYALLQTVKGKDALAIGDLLNDFNYVYSTNLPMRKAAPHVDMKMGSSIKIEFAYGKCNIFDAKKEVWEPLMAIKSSFFPKVVASAKTGLSETKGFAKVPYTTQSFPVIAKVLFSGDVMKKTSLGETFGSVTTKLTEAAKEMAKEYGESGDLKSKLQSAGNTLLDSGADKSDLGEARDLLKKAEGINSQHTGPGSYISDAEAEADANKSIMAVRYYSTVKKYKSKHEHFDRTHVEKLAKFNSSTDADDQELVEDSIAARSGEIETMNKAISSDEILVKMKAGKLVAEVKPKEQNGADTPVEKILKSLAKVKPEIVGIAIEDLAKGAKAASTTISFGFKQEFQTSIEDINKSIAAEGATNKALVKLTNIIPTDVSITFDLSNLDENGYPMAGCLEIKNVWSLDTGGGSLLLSSR